MDFISKNPALFSSESNTALSEEFTEEEISGIHNHMIIGLINTFIRASFAS